MHQATPTDRAIDGQDLSPILFEDGSPGHSNASRHKCIFMYHSGVALQAVRCGRFKYFPDTGKLFDLIADPRESNALPVNSSKLYQEVAANITAARAALLATVVPVVDQVNLGSDPSAAICADPHSQMKYPKLPNCTLNPENWITPWPAPPPPSPPAPPVPASNLVGCFWDKGYPNNGGQRPCDLPIVKAGSCPKSVFITSSASAGIKVIKPMTLELCNALCTGNRYFGVQNGGSGCFCGQAYGKYGSSTNCTMPCAGNLDEVCGGPGANSIYKSTSEQN